MPSGKEHPFHKCPLCGGHEIISTQGQWSGQKRGYNTRICDNCGYEWEHGHKLDGTLTDPEYDVESGKSKKGLGAFM